MYRQEQKLPILHSIRWVYLYRVVKLLPLDERQPVFYPYSYGYVMQIHGCCEMNCMFEEMQPLSDHPYWIEAQPVRVGPNSCSKTREEHLLRLHPLLPHLESTMHSGLELE